MGSYENAQGSFATILPFMDKLSELRVANKPSEEVSNPDYWHV
jgi:hypothetical protein